MVSLSFELGAVRDSSNADEEHIGFFLASFFSTVEEFFVGGNWKCNGTEESISEFVSDLNTAKLEPNIGQVHPSVPQVGLQARPYTSQKKLQSELTYVLPGYRFDHNLGAAQLFCKLHPHENRRSLKNIDRRLFRRSSRHRRRHSTSVATNHTPQACVNTLLEASVNIDLHIRKRWGHPHRLYWIRSDGSRWDDTDILDFRPQSLRGDTDLIKRWVRSSSNSSAKGEINCRPKRSKAITTNQRVNYGFCFTATPRAHLIHMDASLIQSLTNRGLTLELFILSVRLTDRDTENGLTRVGLNISQISSRSHPEVLETRRLTVLSSHVKFDRLLTWSGAKFGIHGSSKILVVSPFSIRLAMPSCLAIRFHVLTLPFSLTIRASAGLGIWDTSVLEGMEFRQQTFRIYLGPSLRKGRVCITHHGLLSTQIGSLAMVDARSGRRGRSDPIEQITAFVQALTARMNKQLELIMRQQQTIQQLNEILAKREQEKEQGSSVNIERDNENEPEVTPQAYMSKQKSLHHQTSHSSPIHKLSVNLRNQKETEFINLKQEDGDMSVDANVAKFIQLPRYSSYLKKCDDEPCKTEKLERGFKLEIRDRVAPQEIRVFNKLVEIARTTENNLKKMGSTPKASFELKKPREEGSSDKNNKKNGRGPWNKKGQGVCYRCRKPGHMARDCSQQKDVTVPSKSHNQGRVFALTQQEASQSPSMIQGIIKINNCLVNALFDSSASHSFISYDCVKRLGMAINVLPYDLSISTPTGMKIVTLDVCLNCIVQFNHCYTTIDLICMPFH
ncbi:retrotransposon-related protein [Senna tora]|uniref:Retrotransposon-related protein n=1 Tax=Senna tora TaxID=362788 RepID=A0A834W6Z7_9FABA|nr:retrotransposon-related protein [Senna tora]